MAIYTHDTLTETLETLEDVENTSDNRVPLDHDSADAINMIGTLLRLKQMDKDDTLDDRQIDRNRKDNVAFLYYYFKNTIDALIKNKEELTPLDRAIFDATIQTAFLSLNRMEDAKDVNRELISEDETDQILDAMEGITKWYKTNVGKNPVTLAKKEAEENSTVKPPARAGTL